MTAPQRRKRRLTALALDRVDLCSAPANPGAWVALMKSAGPIRIAKVDVPKRRVYGFANVSMMGGQELVDAEGDVVSPSELEEAAATFTTMEAGVNHQGGAVGRIFESVFVDAEKAAAMGLSGADGFAGWWVGVQLDAGPVWDAVARKELTAFSVQGKARMQSVDKHVTKTARQLIDETAALVEECRKARGAEPEPEPDPREAFYRDAIAGLPHPGERPHEFTARKKREAAERVRALGEQWNRRRGTTPST